MHVKEPITDHEMIARLKNSQLGSESLSAMTGISPDQMKLILNKVCIITPGIRQKITQSDELKHIW